VFALPLTVTTVRATGRRQREKEGAFVSGVERILNGLERIRDRS
jgi:hypothetical protein